MLFILAYLITGIICIYGVSAGHLIRAELRGYEAFDWWGKHDKPMDWSDPITYVKIIMNLSIWPIRILEFLFIDSPKYYEQYERK